MMQMVLAIVLALLGLSVQAPAEFERSDLLYRGGHTIEYSHPIYKIPEADK